ncbi:MAG: response regulator [Anaerolineae bacterium]
MVAGRDPIRVMIVDDHAVVRSGIRYSLLAFPDLQLVAEAGNGREAVELCARVRGSSAMPEVILMDLIMPEMDGVAATTAILEHHPEAQVLVLTSFGSSTLVQAALRAGAIGYLLKDSTLKALADAIRAAHAGKRTLVPAAVRALVEGIQPMPHLGDDLTDREREVLCLVVDGMSNPQIACQLGISLSTARSHVSTILSKLTAANRAEAAAVAVQYGLAAHTKYSRAEPAGRPEDASASQSRYGDYGGQWDLRGVPASVAD